VKAWTLDAFDAAPALRDDLPEPVAGTGEAVINVKATSVNPVDAAIIGGFLRGTAEYRFPVLLGRDFAGVADGSEVFGFVTAVGSEGVQRGAWAERIAVPADMYLAVKPTTLSTAAAGAAGLAGVTALLCVEAVAPRVGERVLIVGATGGVGSLAIQLAAAAGAHVVAPGLEIDRAYLRALGAVEVPPRGSAVSCDALIDLVSQDADAFAANAVGLREGGATSSPLPGIGDRGAYVAATSDPTAVARLGELIDAENIKVPICEAFSFGQIPDALSALREHKQGKLSVV
jgi:NADPH:quinone reductase